MPLIKRNLNARIKRTDFSNHVLSVIKEARLKYEYSIAADKNPKRLYKYIRTKVSRPVRSIHVRDASKTVVNNYEDVVEVFIRGDIL